MALRGVDKPEISTERAARMRRRLQLLYGAQADAVWSELARMLEQFADSRPPRATQHWSERDVVLISYPDQVQSDGSTPLAALERFLAEHQLTKFFSALHLLPFFPASSDEGFSVVDYRQVDPSFGSWSDVESLGGDFRLGFDLVLNHASRQSEWFSRYVAGEPPFDTYFVDADPSLDLSAVVRPRSSPLLTPVETARGRRWVWTTFSADQVDLNYHNPRVLLEMIAVMLEYIRRGAGILRLDAVAYLWKEPGTSCIHLPQTHELVKLLRDVLDTVAPDVWLLTETNVPHQENIAYFGSGDEAHWVYQFSLPPLLAEAFVARDVHPLRTWLSALESPPDGCAFLNFTASHDGIGVRPLEGLVPPERQRRLVEHVLARGGLVSTRRDEQGNDVPYELNISYVDLLRWPGEPVAATARRFLASQAFMLALQGVPAVYFHSLVGTENDVEGARVYGTARRINRRRFMAAELADRLHGRPGQPPLPAEVFRGYRRYLAVRRQHPAFHPDASQELLPIDHPSVIGLHRRSADGQSVALAILNVGDEAVDVVLPASVWRDAPDDLVSGAPAEVTAGRSLRVLGGCCRWLGRGGVEARSQMG